MIATKTHSVGGGMYTAYTRLSRNDDDKTTHRCNQWLRERGIRLAAETIEASSRQRLHSAAETPSSSGKNSMVL